MLAASFLLASFVAGISAADQNSCPPRRHAGAYATPPAPAVWYAPELPWYLRGAGNGPFTPTKVSDAIAVDLSRAKWFQAFAGGTGNGAYALYDTAHGVSYSCTYADTTVILDAVKMPLEWLARTVPVVRVGPWATSRGIEFGASPDLVESVYGKAPLRERGMAKYLAYEKIHRFPNTTTTFTTRTTFFFIDRKLVAVERLCGI